MGTRAPRAIAPGATSIHACVNRANTRRSAECSQGTNTPRRIVASLKLNEKLVFQMVNKVTSKAGYAKPLTYGETTIYVVDYAQFYEFVLFVLESVSKPATTAKNGK